MFAVLAVMLLKNPTWAGLYPKKPEFTPIQDDIAQALLAVLNVSGQVYSVTFDRENCHHYVIRLKQEQIFYIKLIEMESMSHQAEADQIAKWTKRQGLNVCETLFIKEMSVGMKKWALFAYPYIKGRPFFESQQEISVLAQAVSKLHIVLKDHPDSYVWQENTLARFSVLEDIRVQLAAGQHDVGVSTKAVVALANRVDLDIFREPELSQCLHGDLNPGNIIFSDNEQVYFFDFEDVHHSYLPVITELAYVLERFILVRIESANEAVALGTLFLKNYRINGDFFYTPTRHNKLLEMLILKSICTLIYCREQGFNVIRQEWDKFFMLLKKAEVFQPLLSRMFS